MKTILFDLDGTLLPMDVENFTRTYMGLLAKFMMPYGYDPKKLVDSVWKGTGAMVKNDGSCTNEQRFWEVFGKLEHPVSKEEEEAFLKFYSTDFHLAKSACGCNPRAAELVRTLKEKGHRVVLATNPLFPRIATENRIRWAGLTPEDFDHITTYENSNFCKPNPRYYAEILEKLELDPADCVMIGNDADEDLPAGTTGMDVFLLTDDLLNKHEISLENVPHGSYDDLYQWLGVAV